jgi:hypothetical protein
MTSIPTKKQPVAPKPKKTPISKTKTKTFSKISNKKSNPWAKIISNNKISINNSGGVIS